MTQKKNFSGAYAFPNHLWQQLQKISEHFLTVVEAPSGFGKTTAVREFLKESLRGAPQAHWYTCLGESSSKAWAGICGLFAHANAEFSDKLLELWPVTQETLADIPRLARGMRCRETCYLVIDNYQLFEHPAPRKFLTVLSACQVKNLHIIIITQPLPELPDTTHLDTHHTLCSADFFFDTSFITTYCRSAGIKISTADIEQIQTASQGWIAAIRLQLKNYEETCQLVDFRAIGPLIEIAVWNRLSAREQKVMMGLALLDGFTTRQAAIINGRTVVPKSVTAMLSLDFFIRFVSDKNVYAMHSILRDYLMERFAAQTQRTVNAMYRKAAEACMASSDYFQAARFFLKVADYDAILAMPFTDQYFFNHQEQDIIQFFDLVFQQCPPAVLLRHPLTVLAVGIQFYKKGLRQQYFNIVALMENFLAHPPQMPEKALFKIKGEFEMMLFFSKFNDVAQMGEHHKKAYEYLRHVSDPPRSGIYVGNLPWAVGVPSVMSVYWNKSGGLQQTLEAMDVCLPFYSQLAGGHGMGGEILLRAEICFSRGNDAEAETLCHKTLYASKNAGQTSNCLCAELILARIAILRGDVTAYLSARQSIVREMELARQVALTRVGEMCLARLDMAIGKTSDLPEWLRDTEGIRKTLYSVTQPHAVALHCLMLLLEKRYTQLYALTESMLTTAENMRYALLQTYHLIFLAQAKVEGGHKREAATLLRKALAIALPDDVYVPFAEHGEALLPLLHAGKSPLGTDKLTDCIALCRRWSTGVATLRRLLPGEFPALTPREREIALLLREGFSAKQIAAKLFLAENTVTSTRKTIYSKLGVHSKVELTKKTF